MQQNLILVKIMKVEIINNSVQNIRQEKALKPRINEKEWNGKLEK